MAIILGMPFVLMLLFFGIIAAKSFGKVALTDLLWMMLIFSGVVWVLEIFAYLRHFFL